MNQTAYVIITPARNEEAHIARLIRSVACQTLKPALHLIVNDGSTDRTGAIVESFLPDLEYLRLLTRPHETAAGFGSKAAAFNQGWQQVQALDPGYVANLDADVSLPPAYFGSLLRVFEQNPRLGLACGWVHEKTGEGFTPQRTRDDSVAGPAQCFRTRCLADIGGYRVLRRGGIDTLAEIMARQAGWETRTLRNLIVQAHRPVRTGRKSVLGVRFNKGMVQYELGYHPLYQLASCLYRIPEKPYLVGSLSTWLGYLWAALGRYPHPLAPAQVARIRQEQWNRLWHP